MQATWKCLDDGSWGIYVQAQQLDLLKLLVGQEVEVTRKNGEKSLQKVTEIIKIFPPRPERRVGRKVFAAIQAPAAFCRVEERPKAAAKPRANPAPPPAVTCRCALTSSFRARS